MSKKKTSEKIVDNHLISQPENKKAAQAATNQVDLKEYAKTAPFSFNKANYRLLLLGLGINILGFILMIGGGTDDPAKFDGDALFSRTRITIAPMLIVIGYGVIFYALFRKTPEKS